MDGTEKALSGSSAYGLEIDGARSIRKQNLAIFGLALPLLVLGPSVDADDQTKTIRPLQQALQEGGRVLPRVHLLDGQSVIGRIIVADAETLTIRRPTGGLRIIPMTEISNIEIANSNGKLIRGWLTTISDGRVAWTTDDPSLAKTERDDIAAKVTEDTSADSGGPLIKLPAALAEQQVTAVNVDRAKDDTFVETEQAEPAAVDAPALSALTSTGDDGDSAGRSEKLHLQVRAEPASEANDVMLFQLSLSVPPKEPVAVIYSILSGSATADADYKHSQGVLVFAREEQDKSLAVEIIDDNDIEDAETFQLFVTADPNAVTMDTRTVEAVIQDNDS